MRPINLIPEELRARSGPTENAVPAYAVVGTLAAFVLMMLGLVFYSNKITTLEDQTKAAQAEAKRYQVDVPAFAPINDFANTVHKRTLLIGALSESRFPWHVAMFNLARAIPDTVTLDGVDGSSKTAGGATTAPPAGSAPAAAATGVEYELRGCAKGHRVVAQMLVRMRAMPGVQEASLKSSSVGLSSSASSATPGGTGSEERKQNCGKKPVSFTMTVAFEPITVDLAGLPKPESTTPAAGASAATGAAPAATPASSPTPPPAG